MGKGGSGITVQLFSTNGINEKTVVKVTNKTSLGLWNFIILSYKSTGNCYTRKKIERKTLLVYVFRYGQINLCYSWQLQNLRSRAFGGGGVGRGLNPSGFVTLFSVWIVNLKVQGVNKLYYMMCLLSIMVYCIIFSEIHQYLSWGTVEHRRCKSFEKITRNRKYYKPFIAAHETKWLYRDGLCVC